MRSNSGKSQIIAQEKRLPQGNASSALSLALQSPSSDVPVGRLFLKETNSMEIDHCSPFSPTDPPANSHLSLHYDLSEKLTRLYAAWPGECFENAHTILLSLRLPQMSYAEGWLVWQHAGVLKVIEHAWLEFPELGILDPTLVWHVDKHSAPGLRYFAARRYRDSEMAAHSPEELPTVRYHPGGRTTTGLEHPLYRAAYQQALSHARTLAERTDPPKEVVILPSSLRGEEASYILLRLSGTGLHPISVPNGKQEYVDALSLPPPPTLLYQCPSRRLAGRLCEQLRSRHHQASCQIYQGNWVVISQVSEPELHALLPLLARFGAIAIRVEAQTHQLLLAGVKRPQHCPPQQEHPACLMGSGRRRRQKRQGFSPFLQKP